MRRHRGIIVESSGYKRQKNPDLLIGGRGDLEQFFEDADLFSPVSILDVRCQKQENDNITSQVPSFLGPLERAAVP